MGLKTFELTETCIRHCYIKAHDEDEARDIFFVDPDFDPAWYDDVCDVEVKQVPKGVC